MRFSSNLEEVESKRLGDADYFTYQWKVSVELGIGETITVRYYSASREDTSYEIFDGAGRRVGERQMMYATGRLNRPLVADLNVLTEEYGVVITPDDFKFITDTAIKICESRYGRGVDGGDVIVTIN